MKVNTLALHGYDSLIMNNMAILNKWNWDPIYTVFALSYIQTIYSFHIFFFFPINILIPHCALSIGYYGTVTWQYQNTGDSDGWDDLGGVPSTAYDYAIGGDYSAAPLVGQTLQFRARTSSGTVLATSATYTYTEHQIQVRAFPASLLFSFSACSLLVHCSWVTSHSHHFLFISTHDIAHYLLLRIDEIDHPATRWYMGWFEYLLDRHCGWLWWS